MKSSFSSNGANCIDVDKVSDMFLANDVLIITETESSFVNRGSLFTNKTSFAAFIKGVKAGEFDHFVEDL